MGVTCLMSIELWDFKYHGPLTRYVKLRVAHASGMPGTFPPAAEFKGNRELAIPVCITARAMHVRIAYPRWRGKRSRYSRRIRTRNLRYLARGPLKGITIFAIYDIRMEACHLTAFIWYPSDVCTPETCLCIHVPRIDVLVQGCSNSSGRFY